MTDRLDKLSKAMAGCDFSMESRLQAVRLEIIEERFENARKDMVIQELARKVAMINLFSGRTIEDEIAKAEVTVAKILEARRDA